MKYLLIIPVLFIILIPSSTHAQISSQIDVTTKINVCGDGIAEGPEECDLTDLKSQTCETRGYGPGNLSCDIACGFDYSQCSTPTPTSTPTNVTGTSSPSSTSTSPPSQPTTLIKIITGIVDTPKVVVQTVLCIPEYLKPFDVNSDCKLSISHLRETISLWIENTRYKPVSRRICNFNNDSTCDLVDFSILLYYVKE